MDTRNLPEIIAPLLAWFAENARVLPWREHPSPYYVWISEIMLQQTRVEAVKPFFARFTTELPDVAALAACPEERLLKLWEGLGYYNRVRNMQRAAQLVMREYGGELPDRYKELLKLPGIGSYTAGAIASIAYGQAVPAVDGNVLRVISRICGNEEDISKQSVRAQFEQELQRTMPQDRPGAYNQALMELGATVCLPNGAPDCVKCPVRELCYANRTGRQMELPVKAAKKARRIEERTVLVIRDDARAAVRRRPKKGLLAGLYELPNCDGHLSQEEALEKVKEYGFRPIRILPLASAKHVFSHIEWHMTGYLVLVEDAPEGVWQVNPDKSAGITAVSPGNLTGGLPCADANGGDGALLFVETARTEREYPIPSAFAAYVKYLGIRLGHESHEIYETHETHVAHESG